MKDRFKYWEGVFRKIRIVDGEEYYAESEGAINYVLQTEERVESLKKRLDLKEAELAGVLSICQGQIARLELEIQAKELESSE